MHPSVFIQEEADARKWSRETLAVAMAATTAGDAGEYLLMLDLYAEVGPNDARLRMGDHMADGLAGAFGVSRDFWLNIERSWLPA